MQLQFIQCTQPKPKRPKNEIKKHMSFLLYMYYYNMVVKHTLYLRGDIKKVLVLGGAHHIGREVGTGAGA